MAFYKIIGNSIRENEENEQLADKNEEN